MFQECYPDALRAREDLLLDVRRKQVGKRTGDDRREDAMGVAVSGGGIRSATFALGFFQALARLGRLRDVDYLSSVSGGSYFGAFLGGLFVPRGPADPSVADRPDATETVSARVHRNLTASGSFPIRWLRDNGRYLAPAGSGDLLAAAAGQLRSFVTIHVILGTLALTVFMTGLLVRTLVVPEGFETELTRLAVHGVWLSPYLVPCALILIALVIPLGWAFWLMPGQSIGPSALTPWLSLFGAFGAAWVSPAVAWWTGVPLESLGAWWPWPQIVTTTVVAATFFVAMVSLWFGWRSATQLNTVASIARVSLSLWLSRMLVAFGVLFLFAGFDTLGQTLWARRAFSWYEVTSPWSVRSLIPAAAIPVLLMGARQVLAFMTDRDGRRPTVPVSLLAGVLAAVVFGVHLTLIAATAHGIAWQGGVPSSDPGRIMAASSCPGVCDVGESNPRLVTIDCARCGISTKTVATVDRTVTAPAVGLVICILASLLFGHGWSFLNLSTFQTMYAGRLTRAYLGASNPEREHGDLVNRRLSDAVPYDDIPLADYKPFEHGGPLHIINVTINETVMGESQIEYRDRKGIGLAVGPAGLSAGARHHALWRRETASTDVTWLGWFVGLFRRKGDDHASARPRAAIEPLPVEGFAVFGQATEHNVVERLTVGSWVGISGAAFSTGLGYRTSIALSLLAGYFNLRLGYWWDSYIRPWDRQTRTPPRVGLMRAVEIAIPVQLYLLDEWLARFRGPGRRLWNLSDGGHFENTAAYELIRRRLPFIVVLDDGEDRECHLEDVGNIVRKARIDLGAEISFRHPDGTAHAYTELPMWIQKRIVAGALVPIDDLIPRRRTKLSAGHAVLAKVTYCDSKAESWLLLVKPTRTGREPLDVEQYGRTHAAFPNESTADQFFNEPQWESYRRLGDYIGSVVFQEVER